jgi:hypothetical protein
MLQYVRLHLHWQCDTKLPAKTAQGSQGKYNSLATLKMKQIDVQIE